jgi:hypothetical protein
MRPFYGNLDLYYSGTVVREGTEKRAFFNAEFSGIIANFLKNSPANEIIVLQTPVNKVDCLEKPLEKISRKYND